VYVRAYRPSSTGDALVKYVERFESVVPTSNTGFSLVTSAACWNDPDTRQCARSERSSVVPGAAWAVYAAQPPASASTASAATSTGNHDDTNARTLSRRVPSPMAARV